MGDTWQGEEAAIFIGPSRLFAIGATHAEPLRLVDLHQTDAISRDGSTAWIAILIFIRRQTEDEYEPRSWPNRDPIAAQSQPDRGTIGTSFIAESTALNSKGIGRQRLKLNRDRGSRSWFDRCPIAPRLGLIHRQIGADSSRD